ncbi:MCE family protein [Saccharopolyspora sp. HNM0986]|uniref:MlaD family protein n=1 Tax=Saccharopolyspora galaxeae TaxID=2781241 RepID=UPI00190DC4BE|nr:MCE family protein [Saccharopolyspora sp. HNM0986]MBK0870864.1 MCE family protein [Saccharopolyspora sp. HNM0986]
MKRLLLVGAAVVLVAAVGGVALLTAGRDHHVSVVLGSASKVVPGGTVMVGGFEGGKVADIQVREGKAVLDLALDDDHAPLHSGAQVLVEWKATLGERRVEIQDGPETNPEIPEGGMIPGKQAKPVELDEVLNALDAPTREHLASLVGQLDKTVSGNEADANATLRTAGPALESLGQVMQGLGSDGESIKGLVTQLNGMVGTLSERDADVRQIVDKLNRTTNAVAGQREHLGEAVRALPHTLDTAKGTLDDVPEVADKTIPLLHDLRPATQQLPAVADHLNPVLRDLRPTVDRLGPTLTAADSLLDRTPGLLDTAHATVPALTGTADYLTPALNHLRPYTPELAGWLSSWTSNSANYDSNGHFVRFLLQEGATTLGDSPGIVPPGVQDNRYPLPGENGGQPWKDAWGGGLR